jgi:hypothetical protein
MAKNVDRIKKNKIKDKTKSTWLTFFYVGENESVFS